MLKLCQHRSSTRSNQYFCSRFKTKRFSKYYFYRLNCYSDIIFLEKKWRILDVFDTQKLIWSYKYSQFSVLGNREITKSIIFYDSNLKVAQTQCQSARSVDKYNAFWDFNDAQNARMTIFVAPNRFWSDKNLRNWWFFFREIRRQNCKIDCKYSTFRKGLLPL